MAATSQAPRLSLFRQPCSLLRASGSVTGCSHKNQLEQHAQQLTQQDEGKAWPVLPALLAEAGLASRRAEQAQSRGMSEENRQSVGASPRFFSGTQGSGVSACIPVGGGCAEAARPLPGQGQRVLAEGGVGTRMLGISELGDAASLQTNGNRRRIRPREAAAVSASPRR